MVACNENLACMRLNCEPLTKVYDLPRRARVREVSSMQENIAMRDDKTAWAPRFRRMRVTDYDETNIVRRFHANRCKLGQIQSCHFDKLGRDV